MMIMEIFARPRGNRIKKLRIEKQLTQEELARISGCTRSTISRLEAGNRNPSIELAILISKALDEPVENVFIYEE